MVSVSQGAEHAQVKVGVGLCLTSGETAGARSDDRRQDLLRDYGRLCETGMIYPQI